MRHCGIDVHTSSSELCEVSAQGKVIRREQFTTTAPSLRRLFEGVGRMRVVMECGGSTPWIYRLLTQLGHEVVVVNPRRMRLIGESTLKTDRIDAEILARLSRLDLELLRPVYQRSEEAQQLRMRLRARSSLVRARVMLINQVRGALRASANKGPAFLQRGRCPRRRAGGFPPPLAGLARRWSWIHRFDTGRSGHGTAGESGSGTLRPSFVAREGVGGRCEALRALRGRR